MQFQGLYTALLTPFTKDASGIDFPAFEKLVETQIAAGVAGVVPCGTTGESPTLNHSEHTQLIERTVKIAAGRTAVIAGTGSNSTAEAIALSVSAEKSGADAVMLVNPYYNKPSQEGLYQHFRSVAQAVSVPVVIYNIKGRTAVNLEVATLARLAELPNVQCVKEASGDLGQMIQVYKRLSDSISILSGDDNLIPAVMGIGGRGVISVASNLYPRRIGAMIAQYLNGDFAAGNREFYKFVELFGALFWDTNPIPLKQAAARLGICHDAMRLPLWPMPEAQVDALMTVIEATGADQ